MRRIVSHQDLVGELLHAYRLTIRERQVVGLVLQGLSNKAIARTCSITEQTVKDHLKHVYRKMGVSRRTALMAGLLQFPGARPAKGAVIPGVPLKVACAK